ncbi:hypothetical protein SLEP1_g45365 [Rubroshorea leprosula]|uniref:Uncharacterized protein n=1 Tax=Rubroshorea leprosula TaxID=152421 RepID=A0AAV5LIS4_9ROSI|nr:hypothetical protein SLEP1_g45365 [Rubroshorea leprosula]
MGLKEKKGTKRHIMEYKKGQPLETWGNQRDFREKSKRQPAESFEASLRQSLRRFCVSNGRRKGSHWDTSIENKGDKRDSEGLQI